MNTRLLDALKGNNVGRPPVWLMRQAGRYMSSYQALRKKHSFLTLCHEPELIKQVTLLPIEELSVDAAILFSDILMIPEALGISVRFDDGTGPSFDHPIREEKDLHRLRLEDLQRNLSYLPEAISALKKTLSVPLIGFAGAPFTLASYLIEGKTSRDLKETKRWIYEREEAFQQLITILEEAVFSSLKIQIEAGVDVVQIFDSFANVQTEEHFTKYSLFPLSRIAEKLKPLKKPLIYFCRGSSYLAPLLLNTGIDAISLDWQKPMKSQRAFLGKKMVLQGNLDPEALFAPKERLRQNVLSHLTSMQNDPAYIFNLGHGILPGTPYENVKLLVETVKSFDS